MTSDPSTEIENTSRQPSILFDNFEGSYAFMSSKAQ